jgi:hypothetical protein
MRPRISYLGLALSAATGGANVQLNNNGTIDTFISTTLPGGAVSWGVFRLTGDGSVQMLASNIAVLPVFS